MLKLISRETKDRYSKILKEMGVIGEGVLEKNKVAALYIICAKENLWDNRKLLFDLSNQNIKEEGFKLVKGKGNRALVLLAFNLFNSYKDDETDVFSIVQKIDRQDRDIVINAINIIWTAA
ncbi:MULTISPECIES: DUF6075 family protein [Clostridium]|uniref:Uncharacterized protein n=1 Tax=Clostridium cibarium TaxID=2762247 RepID=A0ABR8PUU7_9CLOT|nr:MULTISPECIES: DUF6075 family protein [Clostridium]MBD7911905.1 hypothetical protein [Clostridium cibarium]